MAMPIPMETQYESILSKIANLDDLCECGGKSN